MSRNFVVSVVVMFVVSMALGFVVHGWILAGDYARLTPQLFRAETDAQGHFGSMIIAHVIFAFGITWIYRQGRDNKPFLAQGLRFGAALALVTCVPTYLIYYAVQPMPSDLVAQQIVFDLIAMLVMGVAVAALNRDPNAARA
jgi:hypothetical protein